MTQKKQSKPSKNPATTKAEKQKKSFSVLFNIISQQTTKERLIFFQTNSKQYIIDLLKDSAYKVPEFKKIKMVTEAIDKLNVPFKDIIMSGVKDEIEIGSIRGNKNPFFFYFNTDIQKFLVKPDTIISSESIDLAYREFYQPGTGYCLFPVSPCIEHPKYEISINTLCITEAGFDYLKEKFMDNSLDRKGEKTIRGSIVIDRKFRLLKYKDDKKEKLEPIQIQILKLLYENKNKLVTRSVIQDNIWGSKDVYDKQITDHMTKIRKAFTELGFGKEIIEAIKTIKKSRIAEGGYIFHSNIIPLDFH
jgi:DNA-binding winged helix-turn-helix (wHTH) protein